MRFARDQSMIPKSGNRCSEKIMLNQKAIGLIMWPTSSTA
jgi:hypothetical protein